MRRYSFQVDDQLRLVARDDGYGRGGSDPFLGAPYYECYPRLWQGADDAVAFTVERGEPLVLSGHRLHCFYGEINAADIDIRPVFGPDGRCAGATVQVTALPGCSVYGEMESARALVDIGKMSVTLAHGVRNPLNAIKGAVVYLKDKYISDATFVEFADIIEEEIHKLDGFITEFLGTSHLEPVREEIQLNELLERVVKLVSLQAQASHVRFNVEYGDLPPVMLDSFNFGHAILNVVNNALGAMEVGGSLSMHTSIMREAGQDVIVVEVADTGPGIRAAGQQELGNFPGAGSRRQGRGYGLFITREIVRHHGGKIKITGNREGGTTVRIMLPVASP
jgi:two-component system nitrogen regulation sensor histidine kinase GlnL